MIKNVLLFAFFIISFNSIAQKAQRIGYIDMEYILQNIPEYTEAQSKINQKALGWQKEIEGKQKEIEALEAELNNEKALLTKELIIEKEEDIHLSIVELKQVQEIYFGSNGDLFFLRQQLVQPIQDLVYNAIQDIAAKRSYDFIFDKSSDLVMLFSNSQYDVSEMVIASLTRSEKLNEIREKREALLNKKNNTTVTTKETVKDSEVADEKAAAINDAQIEKEAAINEEQSEKEAKRLELQKSLEAKKEEQLKKREELKKAIEEKRLQRIQEIEAAKKAQQEKKENN